MLPTFGEVVEIDTGSLERLEVRHPDLPLLHFLSVRWHVLQCAEPPHSSSQEHRIGIQNRLLNQRVRFIEHGNAQLVRVLVQIHNHPEIVENLNGFVVLQVVENPILVRLLRQELRDNSSDALAGLLFDLTVLEELTDDPFADIDRNRARPKARLAHQSLVDDDFSVIVAGFGLE